jgi:hypothetical protein
MKPLKGLALLVSVTVLPACASMSGTGQLRGTSGPVAWEIVNLRQRVSLDGQETRWYYTLVLKETAGHGIQFERAQTGVSGPNIESVPREVKFERRLDANSELRVSDAASLRARLGGLMLAFYRFYGQDDTGKGVTVDVRVPFSSAGVSQQMQTSVAAGPLPPAKSLAADELRSLAGTWQGFYRDDKGFEIPLELAVREDGSFDAAEDDPPRNRFQGSLAIQGGQVIYSQGNDAGTLTLHEGDGRHVLAGAIKGPREGLPARPGAATYTLTYWVQLQHKR